MDIPPDDDEATRCWFDQNVGAKFEVPNYLSTAQEDYHNTPVVWKIQTLAADSFGKDISKLTNNEFEREVFVGKYQASIRTPKGGSGKSGFTGGT